MRKSLALLLCLPLFLLAACGTPAAPIPNPPLVLGEKYLTDLDYEQALLQFDQAITIEPKNPRGYLGKADALLHLDRQADAAAALADGAKQCRPQRAALNEARVEVGKSAVEGYIGLSAAYEKLGWREIAQALLRRVCEELPEESRLREALERLLDAPAQTEAVKDGDTTAAITTTEAPKEQWKRAVFYSAEGTITCTVTYEYDTKGQVNRINGQRSDGTSFFIIYQYNDKGQQIRQESCESDGRSSYSSYEYDDKGQKIRSESHVSDGNNGYEDYEYEYDANGKIVRQISISFYGDRHSNTHSCEYNEAGQLIRSETRCDDGTFSYSTFEYNDEGLRIRDNLYFEEKLSGYTIYEY